MGKIDFSVVVPVYRVEAYLERCVRSVLGQSHGNLELILVDDGSPDGCPALCDGYARQDGRVRVIHQENGGLSRARNRGLEAAKGEYVLFVDADDCIDRQTCEKLLPYCLNRTDILAIDGIPEGGYVDLTHRGPMPGRVYTGQEFLRSSVFGGNVPMAAWLYVFRREFLQAQGLLFKPGILHEDEQFTPRALLAAGSVVSTGLRCYHYLIRENSITTQPDKRKNADDFYATCLELSQLYGSLADKALGRALKNLLAKKYLSLSQQGRLYRYGRAYLRRRFVLTHAAAGRTRRKAVLYCLSPRLYWHLNRRLKGGG